MSRKRYRGMPKLPPELAASAPALRREPRVERDEVEPEAISQGVPSGWTVAAIIDVGSTVLSSTLVFSGNPKAEAVGCRLHRGAKVLSDLALRLGAR